MRPSHVQPLRVINFGMPTHIATRLFRDLVTPRISEAPQETTSGLSADVADLYAVAMRDRWGLALVWVGLVHLGIFVFCEWLYDRGDRAESHFVSLWCLDAVFGMLIFRRFLSRRDGGRSPSLLRLVVRIWVTFLILAFSAASLNTLGGLQTTWFKVAWAILSTFGFAMMAWIFHLKFLVQAFQMSLTALLIARFPAYAYGIYGFSWCLALTTVGFSLEKRRRLTDEARRVGSIRSESNSKVVDIG